MRNYKKKKKFIIYVSEFHFSNLFILIFMILISISQDCDDTFYWKISMISKIKNVKILFYCQLKF